MTVTVHGEVLSFDPVKGYGFIAPSDGGADVFLHVNDLLTEKQAIKPGVSVEFVREAGERGPKASRVSLASSGGARREPARSDDEFDYPLADSFADTDDDTDEDFVDVLSPADFEREITEALLRADATLTSSQILAVRKAFAAVGTKRGWISAHP